MIGFTGGHPLKMCRPMIAATTIVSKKRFLTMPREHVSWFSWRIGQMAAGGFLLLFLPLSHATDLETSALPTTIERVKPSVVAIGTLQPTRRPPGKFLGTGFAVGDGSYVLTNAHVAGRSLATEEKEALVLFIGDRSSASSRELTLVAQDPGHDLSLLKISGSPLIPLKLGDSDRVREGEVYAFTGFPIGSVLGLRPVTHRGLISAITPIVTPSDASAQLDPKTIRRLQSPFEAFQLDATAYPGNSGSPLYHPLTGEVIGVINMVFVKETKESVLEKPSGISYAIPINFAADLLRRAGVTINPKN